MAEIANETQGLPSSLNTNLGQGVPGVPPFLPKGPPPDMATINQDRVRELVSSATQKDIPNLRGQSINASLLAGVEEEKSKNEQAQMLAQREQERTKNIKDIGEREKLAIKQHQSDLRESSPFAPTKENAGDLFSLFSLMTIATFGSGGKGQYHGMRTLAALNGMMEGYNQGKKDRHAQEAKDFEENLKALESHNKKAQAIFDDAMKSFAIDKEAGEQKIRELIANDNTGPIARAARSGNLKLVANALDTITNALQAARDIKDKQSFELSKLAKEHEYRVEESGVKAIAKIDREVYNEATKHYSKLDPKNLTNLSQQGTRRIIGSLETIKSIEDVAQYIKDNPKAVGAAAKLKNILNYDALKSVAGDDKASSEAKAAIIDQQIDTAIAKKQLTADEASAAKVLNKMIFAVALQDVQSSGQRGSVYLDKSFQNLYDQASQITTLTDILDARIKESNRRLEVVDMDIANRDDKDRFELTTQGSKAWIDKNFPMVTPTELKKRMDAGTIKSGDYVRTTDGKLKQVN